MTPSQYSTIAASFSLIQSDTARWSAADRYPVIKPGVGRTPNTAVCDGSIRSPCCNATLTRTSCRALPRSLTHTSIGMVTHRANCVYTLAQIYRKPKTPSSESGSGANEPVYHDARPTLVQPFCYNSN